MDNVKKTSGLFSFGPFSLDPVVPVLLRDKEVVPLQLKAVETLVALVERHGEVVMKGDLMKAVWGDSFVEEGNLTGHITALRKALGDETENPTYIETVHRRGYRFRAPVTEVPRKEEIVIPPQVPRRRWIKTITAAVVLVPGILAILYWRSGQKITLTRSEVDSPADAAEVRRVVEQSQMFESLELYTNPNAVADVRLEKYWLPENLGGKEISKVRASLQGLRDRGRRYGSESRVERFEFIFVRILARGDLASVGTIERWYLPTYQGENRVADVNAYLGPYSVEYTLRKVNGAWLIAESTTPRRKSAATPPSQ